MRRRLLKQFADDSGMVLIAVVGLLLLITIIGMAAWVASQENFSLTVREKRSTSALHVAEAGLDTAMWKLKVMGTGVPPSFSVTTPNGTASVTTSSTGVFTYDIISVGSVPGTPTVTRTVSTQVFAMSLWNMILASGSSSPVGSGGGHFNGNGNLVGPFYMRGSLDFTNGDSGFFGGPLFIKKGDIVLGGSSQIGTNAEPVQVFCDGTYPVGNANFHPAGNVSPNVPDISLPRVNDKMAEYRTAALQESVDGRVGTKGSGGTNSETRTVSPPSPPGKFSTYYKIIDNDTQINESSGGLTLSAGSAFGVNTDDFALVGGVLYVRGTVFVDGPITIQGPLTYSGNGTLVANGNIEVYGNLMPQGAFPSVDALGLTTTGSVRMHTNGSTMRAAIYAAQSFDMVDNNQLLEGAVLTNTFGLPHGGEIRTQPQLPAYLPPSLPGGDGNVVFPSAWHDGRK